MKIPGLTFIIIPVLCWLLYIYSENIINMYNINPKGFILICIVIYSLGILVELFGFRVMPFKTDREIINSTILLIPFILTYKLLVYINNKLTINI